MAIADTRALLSLRAGGQADGVGGPTAVGLLVAPSCVLTEAAAERDVAEPTPTCLLHTCIIVTSVLLEGTLWP